MKVAALRRVALIVARLTGKRVGADTVTQMALDADFSDQREPGRERRERTTVDFDPLEELQRLTKEGK